MDPSAPRCTEESDIYTAPEVKAMMEKIEAFRRAQNEQLLQVVEEARHSEEERLLKLQKNAKLKANLVARSKRIPIEDVASIHKTQAKLAELKDRKFKLINQFEVERSKDELKVKRMVEDHQAALKHRMDKFQEWLQTNRELLGVGEALEGQSSRPASSSRALNESEPSKRLKPRSHQSKSSSSLPMVSGSKGFKGSMSAETTQDMRFLSEMYRKTDGPRVRSPSVKSGATLSPADILLQSQARRSFLRSMDADNQRLGVQHVIDWSSCNSKKTKVKPAVMTKVQLTSNQGPTIDREAIMRRNLLVHKRKLLQDLHCLVSEEQRRSL